MLSFTSLYLWFSPLVNMPTQLFFHLFLSPPPGKLSWQMPYIVIIYQISTTLPHLQPFPPPLRLLLAVECEEVWPLPRGTLCLAWTPVLLLSAAMSRMGGAPGIWTMETCGPDLNQPLSLSPASQTQQRHPAAPRRMSEKWAVGETPPWLCVAALPQQRWQQQWLTCPGQTLEDDHVSMPWTYTSAFSFQNNLMKCVLLLGSFYKWGREGKKSDVACPKPHCWDPPRTPSYEGHAVSCSVGDISGVWLLLHPHLWIPRFPQEFL